MVHTQLLVELQDRQASSYHNHQREGFHRQRKIFDVVMEKCALIVRRMPTMSEASATVRSSLETAFEYLQDENVGMIGIYSMGGVGKTSLLKRINNHQFVVVLN